MGGTRLASWNEGSAKDAVLDFVQRVTTEGPDFVPVADRVAAFDVNPLVVGPDGVVAVDALVIPR